jgi:hypothetical protein
LKWWRVAGIGDDQLISKESNMSDLFKDLTKRNMGGAGSPEITREAAVAAALVLINS